MVAVRRCPASVNWWGLFRVLTGGHEKEQKGLLMTRPAGCLSLLSSLCSLTPPQRAVPSLPSILPRRRRERSGRNSEFRNPCVPVTHPHERGQTHARTPSGRSIKLADDSCITKDWHWLVPGSFLSVCEELWMMLLCWRTEELNTQDLKMGTFHP